MDRLSMSMSEGIECDGRSKVHLRRQEWTKNFSGVVVRLAVLCILPLLACQKPVEQLQLPPVPKREIIRYRLETIPQGTTESQQISVSQPKPLDKPHRPDYAARRKELQTRFSPEQLQILEKLNRSDLNHIAQLPLLVIPEVWRPNELVYSPLPWWYPWAAQHAKALVIHQPSQTFGGYESGRLVHWGPISSGDKTSLTPSGFFHLTWKDEGRRSTVDEDWFMPWYFNFHNDFGLSLHQYALPGYPASHACARLLERDAQWLYHWGEEWALDERGWNVLKTGTPLLIIGHYNFDAPPPWRSIAWLHQEVELPANPPLEHDPPVLSGPAGP